jgi:hypothetical protein
MFGGIRMITIGDSTHDRGAMGDLSNVASEAAFDDHAGEGFL